MVRLFEVPPLYVNTYTYTMKIVGILYDVIGNIKNPYGLVKATSRDDSIIGQAIYVKPQELERKRRK
ncbi:hypothetical protein PAE3330 [Pyrobaculum aerophilum str. IM2]|uniref:H/ACA RNA-protein complex protein Gar1 n=1 Tax=Pyrobaculum aerophilum (strain ATCC 51768 / DSM 7523 / JCM 9630 / CIP 104966 / NBRC 100827 / IM2) TaxID=178306 RepID=Q8ZTB9_PYRAE|nr:hypothetical protein PAE3330 [Pyrobaculum aerophilum str. IM2]